MIAIASPRKEFGTRAEARTKEIERCLKMHPDYILMMDADQTMPSIALEVLYDTLVNDHLGFTLVDMIVIDSPSKNADDSNIKYHPDGTLAYATISCCLIKAEVFNKIKKPWFSSKYMFREEGTKNGKIVWNMQEKQTDDNRDEDVYFMRKCIDAGLAIDILDDLKCNHFDLGEI